MLVLLGDNEWPRLTAGQPRRRINKPAEQNPKVRGAVKAPRLLTNMFPHTTAKKSK